MRFSDLRKNLKKDYSRFPEVRMALLGDTPTQFFHQALRGTSYEHAVDARIFEADFDQIDQQALDPGSSLHEFQAQYVIVFQATHKLLERFYRTPVESRSTFAERRTDYVRTLFAALSARRGTRVLYCNFPEVDDQVFGAFANKVDASFVFQLRRLNVNLMTLASELPDLHIVDLSSIQNRCGRDHAFNPAVYATTGFAYDIEFWPQAAAGVLGIVQALRGPFKKAVVLDLDNTLWGGVVGDDGLERLQIGDLGIGKCFTEFQLWLRELRRRGILLSVCSKNYEHVARQVFEDHPDMVLRLDDIAVFVANWDNKVDNIRYIQSVLNIGFDSIVYFDDSAFERQSVREAIPELTVPDLPEDPAAYLPFLQSLNLFETASVSANDDSRTRQYQDEAMRQSIQKTYASETEFLEGLQMTAVARPFDRFHTPRIAQLSQRSNQFNLRTVRYTEQDVERVASDSSFVTRYFTLADKFGDYGLISLVILQRQEEDWFIETWLMSCRVLKRQMEEFVLNVIMEAAREQGVVRVVGEYLPTAKNQLVAGHYPGLGFVPEGDRWVMSVADYRVRPTFIRPVDGSGSHGS